MSKPDPRLLLVDLIESIGQRYVGKYSNDNFVILGRRWDVLKIIIGGVNKRNYNQSLELLEDLIDKERGLGPDSRDEELLNKLAIEIAVFEEREEY